MIRNLIAAAALALSPALTAPAAAQSLPINPVGQWRCISNSQTVSIDMMYNVGQGGQLSGQGSIVYAGTWRSFNVAGYGRWLAAPPDHTSNQWLLSFQILPQNHASFTVYARPTNDPNALYNSFYNQQTGGTTETSCARVR
ncbi:MAG: hypothetical protein AAF216_07100 [Pseudomonadota bacterium]